MIRIITNKRYKEMNDTINFFSERISDLKTSYENINEAYNCLDETLYKKSIEVLNLEEEKGKLNKHIDELKAENKSLKAAKGGYASVMSKLKKDLEETQKKLEESMTDKYLVKKVPMGKLPKSQVMKMKSHAKQDKIIQKIYEKMEKDEI